MTGLPPGVDTGPLGKRAVAHIIDWLLPAVVASVLLALLPRSSGSSLVVAALLGSVLTIAWALVCWWMLATRAATPGMRLRGLQLVGFKDGRPIGWVRVLVRGLVLIALMATVIGWLIMLLMLLQHPRKQGWHDLAADAVMIKERLLAPPKGRPAASHPQAQTLQPAVAAQGGQGAEVAAPPSHATAGAQERRPLAEPAASTGTDQQTSPAGRGSSVAARSPREGWVAILDDGRALPVGGLVLLGRNPQAQPGEEDAELIKLADPTRTVSKSHIALGVDADGMFVVDRNSTNGSTVTTSGGVSTRCPPGQIVHVAEGSIVSIGDHWLEVRRNDGQAGA